MTSSEELTQNAQPFIDVQEKKTRSDSSASSKKAESRQEQSTSSGSQLCCEKSKTVKKCNI